MEIESLKKMSSDVRNFENLDYIIFSLMLSISVGIGIFFGCFGKKQETSQDIFVTDRKMGVFPVSMSLLASFISSATILGGPLESYAYGLMYLWSIVGFSICACLASYIFVPLFYNLGYTSAYQVKNCLNL